MSNELTIFKQNRIKALENNYNNALGKLNLDLKNGTKKIQNTLLSSQQKQSQINNLVVNYNKTVNALKQNVTMNVLFFQNFNPNPIIVSGRKNALLVGINYIGTSNELRGCINDVHNVKDRLVGLGFNNIGIMTDVTGQKPTKANILNEFKTLLLNSQPGDLLFFQYSGHGSYKLDKNNDETTGYDQVIVPLDSANMITDDELKSIIQTNLKEKVTLFAMFDSCFSGTVLDLRYQYMDSLNYDKYTENAKQTDTLGDVFMISGCNDYQTSADAYIDKSASGAMTWSLLEALKQKPKCTWRELVKNMRNLLRQSHFDQIPQFSSGTIENIDLPVFI